MDNKKNAAENGTTQIIKGGTANTGTTPATTPKITKTTDTTSTETKATTTRTGKAATGTETPEAVSLVDTKTGKDGSTMTPSTDNSITATIKTDTAQTAEDATGTPGENSTGDAKTTEDVIYHVLGVNGKDKAYLVHIDPSIFSETSWTHQKIEIAVTGTNHVTVTAPEHYDGEITDEVLVSLDTDGQLCIACIPVTPDAATDSTAQTAEDATGTLVPAYLSGGYYKGEGKNRYPDPALVDQAETIGKSLAAGGVTATAFNRLMRTLKAGKNKPFEAQTGALKKVIPQVIDLENRKKAPPLLREIVERNRAAVQSEADFAACLDHLRDIGVFLVAEQK